MPLSRAGADAVTLLVAVRERSRALHGDLLDLLRPEAAPPRLGATEAGCPGDGPRVWR